MRDPRGSYQQRRRRRRRRRETIYFIANLCLNLRRLRVLLVFVVDVDHIHARVHVVRAASLGLRLPLHRAPVQRRGRRRRDG